MRTTALRHTATILLLAGAAARSSSSPSAGSGGALTVVRDGWYEHHGGRGLGRSAKAAAVTDVVQGDGAVQAQSRDLSVTIDGKNIVTAGLGESMSACRPRRTCTSGAAQWRSTLPTCSCNWRKTEGQPHDKISTWLLDLPPPRSRCATP
jgi:hypothetical protein